MGFLSGLFGQQNAQQTQNISLPGFQRPFVERGLGALQSAFDQGLPIQNQIIQGLLGQFNDPNSLTRQAQGAITPTLRGDFLPGSEGFQQQLGLLADDIAPAVNSRFALGGRFNSGLRQEGLLRNISDAATRLSGSERDRIGRFSQLAPGLERAQFSPLLQAQQLPMNNALRFLQGAGGNFGRNVTSTTPTQGPGGSLLGLGLGLGGGFLGGLRGDDLLESGGLGLSLGRLF